MEVVLQRQIQNLEKDHARRCDSFRTEVQRLQNKCSGVAHKTIWRHIISHKFDYLSSSPLCQFATRLLSLLRSFNEHASFLLLDLQEEVTFERVKVASELQHICQQFSRDGHVPIHMLQRLAERVVTEGMGMNAANSFGLGVARGHKMYDVFRHIPETFLVLLGFRLAP